MGVTLHYITELLKAFNIVLISSVKFLFAAPISFRMGFNWFETIVFTTLGGIVGVVFFYYLSHYIIALYKYYLPKIMRYLLLHHFVDIQKIRDRKPRTFSRGNRFIAVIRSRFGLIGIASITPILLSIPIGAIIASRYYSKRPNRTLLFLVLAVAVWSVIMSTAYLFSFTPYLKDHLKF